MFENQAVFVTAVFISLSILYHFASQMSIIFFSVRNKKFKTVEFDALVKKRLTSGKKCGKKECIYDKDFDGMLPFQEVFRETAVGASRNG